MSEVLGSEDPEVILAERRYDAIARIMESAVRKEDRKEVDVYGYA